MTIRFVPATPLQYVSCADSAGMTYPATDWSLAWLAVIDANTRPQSDPHYWISNGPYNVAGTLHIAYQLLSSVYSIKVYVAGTQSPDTTANNYATGAHVFVLEHTAGVLNLRSCPVLTTAASDTSAVVHTFSGFALTTALDGPNAMYFGSRGDLATNRLANESLGRIFRYDGLITDAELVQLAFGKEITDLGKVPAWYARMDTVTDLADRGTQGNTFTSNGAVVTGTDPGFGYVAGNAAPTITGKPVIVGTPQVGVATSYTPATAAGTPTPTTTQQWAVGGTDVANATGLTFTPTTVGQLTVRQIDSNGIGSPATATSDPVTIIAAGTGTPTVTAVAMAAANVRRGFPRVSGAAVVPMSGTYTGAAPSSIEYQLYAADGATVLKAWTALSATIGSGNWSASPSVPQGGLYRLAIRTKDSGGAVLATSTIDTGLFGVGAFAGIIGSSTADKWTNSDSGSSTAPAANVGIHKAGAWTVPTSDGAINIVLNDLATRLGVPVFGFAYGVGYSIMNDWDNEVPRGYWAAFASAVTSNGGKLEVVIGSCGSNDIANNDVTSRAEFLRKLNLMTTNCRTVGNNATLPVFWRGVNRRTGVSDVLADYVRTAEQDFGGQTNCYNIQALDFELSGDGTHLTPAGFIADCTRISKVVGPVMVSGASAYLRGMKHTAFEYGTNTIRATLQHRGGSDFTPTSNITGYTVSDATGALAIVSAVRVSATQVLITCDRAFNGVPVVKYLSGAAPVVGTQLFDNSSATMPTAVEPYMVATVLQITPPTTNPGINMREFKDRVQDTTQTTGTGPLTLDGATIAGFRSFGGAHTVGSTLEYFIGLGTDWECGLGTLTASNTLARTTVNASSNGGALVNFAAGSKTIFGTVGASTLANLASFVKDANNNVQGLQTVNGVVRLGKKEWRGMGQAMSVAVQGFAGASSWSATHRTRHYSNVRFRRVRAVLQTFYPTGTPIADTNFVDDYNFQVGFEVGYTNATTGLSPRKMFTFDGSQTAQYLAASPPSTGYILSDVLDLGAYVEAKDFFGLWTTVENPAQGANKIPYTRSGSNFLQRFVGNVVSTTSNIANDVTRSATSVTAQTSAQAGAAAYFTPVMLLIETDSGLPFITHISDSLGYGVGEGVAGSGNEGDGLGSALGNNGLIDRAVYESLGYTSVNLGKGSDGNKFLMTPANWAKRSQLLVLSNPTHVINANVHNDMSFTTTFVSWAASTAFAKGDVTSSSSNDYLCLKAGTSGTVALSGTGGGIVDGTVIWAYITPHAASSVTRGVCNMVSQMANVNSQILALLPAAKIIGMLPTPDAASTDVWATNANQTPNAGWGVAGTRRSLMAGLMRSLFPPLQLSGYFDPSAYLEDLSAGESSKWVSNGTASLMTNDGTHGNSHGYASAMPALTASKFV